MAGIFRIFALMKTTIIFVCLMSFTLLSSAQTYQDYVRKGLEAAAEDSIDLAEKYFREAMRAEPAQRSNAMLYYYIGQIQERRGQTDLAMESYAMGLNIAPHLIPLRMGRAALYMHLGRPEKALVDYSDILDWKPDYVEALFMRVLILGGVAAGTKTAAKFKRLHFNADVTILTKDKDISYAGCGLPYYVGNVITEKEKIIVNTPQKFAALTGANVLVGREAIHLDATNKTVTAKNLETGENEVYAYDACVIATGASSIVPPVEGVSLEGVFTMRTPQDAENHVLFCCAADPRGTPPGAGPCRKRVSGGTRQ